MTRLNGSSPPLPTTDMFNEHAGESCFASPFSLNRPQYLAGPVLFDSPHSGDDYPAYILETTNRAAMDTLTDIKVNYLLRDLPAAGFPTLCAHFPRVMIDLNRPQLGNAELIRTVSSRRLLSDNETSLACNVNIDLNELLLRTDNLYSPYHNTLRSTLNNYRANFGHAVLLDMHSYSKQVVTAEDFGVSHASAVPDIILGTNNGLSASNELTETIAETFRQNGLSVMINKLFTGAHIVKTYGRPNVNLHAIQIEMAENYFDRGTGTLLHGEADHLSATLEKVGNTTLDWLKSQPDYRPAITETDSVFQAQHPNL